MILRGRGVLLGRQGAGSTPGCPSGQRGTAEVSGAEPPGPCWGSRGARNTGQGEGWAGGCPLPLPRAWRGPAGAAQAAPRPEVSGKAAVSWAEARAGALAWLPHMLFPYRKHGRVCRALRSPPVPAARTQLWCPTDPELSSRASQPVSFAGRYVDWLSLYLKTHLRHR